MSGCCCTPFGDGPTPPAGPTQPFRGTYYIDPTFAGTTSTGSEQNPFKTTAAAWAFALSVAVTSGILYLAPGTNLVENPTFPLTGDWEIACQVKPGVFIATITGNVVVSSSASARRSLSSVNVTGTLTGNCSAGTLRVYLLTQVQIAGVTTLTQTGAGVCRLNLGSPVQDFTGLGSLQNFLVGAVTIAGTISGSNGIFQNSLSVTGTSSLQDCLMPPTTTLAGAGTIDLWLFNCSNAVGGSLAFTASGGGQLRLRCDGVTLNEFARVGLVPTGNVALFAANGGRSSTTTQVSNVGVTGILGRFPAGLQVMEACLTLLTNAGATAGNAVLNAVYTDAAGVLVTEPVTTALNVAGAVGTKARGTLPFSQNGTAAVSWSVTGITNATSLTYKCDVACRQAS